MGVYKTSSKAVRKSSKVASTPQVELKPKKGSIEAKVERSFVSQGKKPSKAMGKAKSGTKAESKTKSKASSKATAQKRVEGSSSKKLSANEGKMQSKLLKNSHLASPLLKRSAFEVARGFTDVVGETVCREVACEGLATSGGYCRLHYIKNWKKIKRKELILKEKKLNQYIEELVAKYPDKYIEAIRQDLANDKDFAKVIYDLDLDEGVDDFDIEGAESADSLIDTIKRDFDDEGDAF